MARRFTLKAALAVATAGLSAALMTGTAAVPAALAAEDLSVRQVEGRVVDVRPEGRGLAEVRLNDGTRLTLLVPEAPTTERLRPGSRIEAQYRESGGENIVISLRVIPDTQAP